MEIIPLGGAGTVTGSSFLLLSGRTRVLVDAGLFQGLKTLRLRNWRPFPISPLRLNAVVLTHAHLDHSGYLPILVRDGFEGPIHATGPTRDLLPILLEDAGRLQEEDADFANRRGHSRHSPALPLFTERDAERVEGRVQSTAFHTPFRVGPFEFTLHRAGHILGAASVEVRDRSGRSAYFSGDLGRPDDALVPPPDPRPETDLVVMESTYGDRVHPEASPEELLRDAVRPTIRRGGVVLIPSFALGRAQLLTLLLHRLMESGDLPQVPLFVNSPMATRVTEVHRAHLSELVPEAAEFQAALDRVTWVGGVEESKALNRRRGPMIIIAGAGMLTGGRILHHLLAFGGDRRNTLVLSGYQAEGTRGRELRRGGRTIRIHGESVTLGCEIQPLDALSAHADQSELLRWVEAGAPPGEGVALVHGEPGPADALRRELAHRTGWQVTVAEESLAMDFRGNGAASVPVQARGRRR